MANPKFNRPRSKKTKKASIRDQVKREVSRVIETKDKKYDSGIIDLANFANTTNNGNNTIELTPSSSTLAIQQGVLESQRVGNSIRTVSAEVRFRLSPKPYHATENSIPVPQVVMGVIWSIRSQGQALSAAQTITNNSILQNNNASTGFTGDLRDYMRDYNNDEIMVHKKFFLKLGASLYSSNTGNQANMYNFANNDFPLCVIKRIDLTKYYPKVIKFNDGDNDGNCRSLYMTLSPCDADGGANVSTTNAIPVEFEYGLHLKYKDA
jgi:hypothetical protein